MERGIGDKTTLQELQDDLGIKVKAIVTIEEILNYLYHKEVDGKIIINDEMKLQIEAYQKNFGS